jgi:O-antigen/teichoic acid export membrane protein
VSILNKYFKNTSWYIFGSSIQGLTPLLLTPVLTRTLSQTEFSQFVLYIAIATILSFLFSLGLPAALTRELILDSKNLKNNLTSLVLVKRILLIFSLLFILGSIFFTSLTQVIILSIALSMSLAVVQIDMAAHRAQQQASKFVFLAISSTALPTLLMTIFVATGYLKSYFIIFYTLFVLLLTVVFNLKALYTSGDNQRLSSLFKLGAPTIPHGLGMSLMQYGDRVIIASVLGLTAAGKIQIAALLGTAPLLLLSTLNHAWIPLVLEKFKVSKQLGIKFLNTSTTLMAIFISIISLIIMVLNSHILNIFAPTSFNLTELSPVVVVMTISSVIYVFYLRNTHVLTYLGKFQSLAWITPISIFLQILFIFGLSSTFNLLSVAFAILVASSSQAVLTQLAVYRLASELKLTTKPLIFIVVVSLAAILILI